MIMDKKTIEKVEGITLTKYDEKDVDLMLRDLLVEYDKLLDEYNDYKLYVEDNYIFKEMR